MCFKIVCTIFGLSVLLLNIIKVTFAETKGTSESNAFTSIPTENPEDILSAILSNSTTEKLTALENPQKSNSQFQYEKEIQYTLDYEKRILSNSFDPCEGET
ncbi:hypothetical protein HMI54_001393 [Coelomomyces lativittatus]|nr:hypothetical protein HMI56_000285 [Coelomomyces lativittatus]KAJ1510698.1 hypothetical protein HMI54_001393 [Coelomomyces lativittatus]KAJ1517077.1 hypothetical protein HMI55_000687 [Coelomomyces lativittatus]